MPEQTEDDGDLQYPLVKVTYVVQYQVHRQPGTWWEAQADGTTDLNEAIEFSQKLATGKASPRGNPRASVSATRIAQTTKTTVIIQGEKSV
ncbi:hypothetical protein ACWGQT_00705 [Streptomyces yangpuensis]